MRGLLNNTCLWYPAKNMPQFSPKSAPPWPRKCQSVEDAELRPFEGGPFWWLKLSKGNFSCRSLNFALRMQNKMMPKGRPAPVAIRTIAKQSIWFSHGVAVSWSGSLRTYTLAPGFKDCNSTFIDFLACHSSRDSDSTWAHKSSDCVCFGKQSAIVLECFLPDPQNHVSWPKHAALWRRWWFPWHTQSIEAWTRQWGGTLGHEPLIQNT